MYQQKNKGILFASTVIILSLVLSTHNISQAVDAKVLLKQVNKELRQAERDMFSGKLDKAIFALQPIENQLIELKQIDPNNPQLKTAENKYKKLVKDLERRSGKDLGGGTPTAAEITTQTTPSKAKAQDKLPYEASKPLREATSQINRMEGYFKKLSDPKSSFNKEQLVRNIDKSLVNARTKLDKAKSLAAKKGVTSHPDLDQAEKALVAAQQKATEAKQRYEGVQAATAASSEKVNADVKALLKVYRRVESLLGDGAGGAVISYNDLQTAKELLSRIENFEKKELAKVSNEMNAFAQKYGSMQGEIDQKTEAMGYSGQGRASFPYMALSEAVENVQKTRTVMADDLIRRASEIKNLSTKAASDFARLKQHRRVKSFAMLAARFDPDNSRVKAFNSGLDSWIEEDMKAFHAKIDKATLPGNAENAPDNAGKLSVMAVDFLQKEENKRANNNMEVGKVLRVVVRGPWKVFKTNLLGEPIQYNLPILMVKEYESDKELNVIRVYQSSLLTQEYKGVKKAPPFLGIAVGGSYYIRPSVLK